MKSSFRKIISLVLCLAVFSGIFALYSFAASPKITGIKIVTIPTKTKFYEEEDWVYGVWLIDEVTGKISLLPTSEISFTHNPCGGNFPERGMIDMTGLVIDVSYSDGTTTRMTYKEVKNLSGGYSANILCAPKGGTPYFVGTNTIEVYLKQNTSCYDSYDIEICEKRDEAEPFFKVKNLSSVYINDENIFCNMPTGLTLSNLKNNFFDYQNVEVSFSKVLRAYKYYGTGSKITVKYPDGKEEIYTLVTSGDIDGNGIVDSNDTELARLAIIDSSILTRAQFLAANVDGMRTITENDIALITAMAASY